MATLRVVHLRSPDAPHLEAFAEVADALVESLQALGHRVTRSADELDEAGTNIVLGWHLLSPEVVVGLPKRTILYNFEQLDGTPFLQQWPPSTFNGKLVWDYSRKNVEIWNRAGVEQRHVPIGHSPVLERIEVRPEGERDIDVFFYGSINDRRRAVLEQIAATGARVEIGFGSYGSERDELIARSKLVLNVSYYPAGILEIVRLSYLFANRVAVVCERSADHEAPDGYDDAAAYVPYGGLVDTVGGLLGDESGRRSIAEAGHRAFTAKPWKPILAAALKR